MIEKRQQTVRVDVLGDSEHAKALYGAPQV